MKKLEELGISKVPWSTYVTKKEVTIVTSAGFNDLEASLCRGKNRVANARLIAVAPELYECLCESIEEKCSACIRENGVCQMRDGHACGIMKWRAAIAKASGETEAK